MSKRLITCAAALGIGLWAAGVRAQPSAHDHDHGHDHGHDHAHGQDGAPAEYQPVKVGPQHEVLLKSVGKWKTVEKHWENPESEPVTGYGTSTVTKILDGLAIMVEHQSTNDMGTFKGFGVFTWNQRTAEYEGNWLDVMCHDGMDPMVGTYDSAAKTMTWTYHWTLPDGTKFPCRMVEKRIGNDQVVATFYTTPPNGQEFKMMEIAYSRM